MSTSISDSSPCSAASMARPSPTSDLSECGLLVDYAKAVTVRQLLRTEYPENPHARCCIWAIWRMKRTAPGRSQELALARGRVGVYALSAVARTTPQALFDEIRSVGGPWRVSGLRFTIAEEDERPHQFGAFVTLSGGGLARSDASTWGWKGGRSLRRVYRVLEQPARLAPDMVCRNAKQAPILSTRPVALSSLGPLLAPRSPRFETELLSHRGYSNTRARTRVPYGIPANDRRVRRPVADRWLSPAET